MKKIFITLSAAICVALFTFSTAAADDPVKIIRAIRVENLNRISEKELMDIVGFNTGDEMSEEALRDGIRRAFAKGIFFDVRAVTEPYEGGVILTYVVQEIPVVRKIIVEGNRKMSDKEIEKVIQFRVDEDFREEYIARSRKDLLGHYLRRGFPSAEVAITGEQTKRPYEMDVMVRIDEGPPLIIREIDVPEDIREMLRIHEGGIFDRDSLDREMKRLTEYLKDRNYVRPAAGPYEFVDGRLVVPVQKGPRLEMSFNGNTAVSTKDLKKEAPFFEEQSVNDETVQEAIDRMRALYLSRGYYNVQIAAGIQASGDEVKVTFIIYEGKKVILEKIQFKGVSIAPDILKGITPLEEGRAYDDTLLETSIESVVRFYNALGYLYAEVKGTDKKIVRDGSGMELVFDVSEGPQILIGEIAVSGNSKIDTASIREEMQLQEDIPYNVVDIGDARYRVLSLYGKYGFIDAQVDVDSEVRDEKAFVNFRITENRQSLVGKVIYRGNLRTKAKIIDREFSLSEGDILNSEELVKIKQRLYRLGIFNEVTFEFPGSERYDGDRVVRDILVSMKEGNAGSVEISLGYGDYEQFRGALDINYRNLGGYNRQLGFHAEMSSVAQRYSFSFKEPRFLNRSEFPLTVTLLKEETRSVNIDTNDVLYEIDRTSLLLGVEKEIRKRWKTNLTYEYSFVDTHDVQPGIILTREDKGTIGIGSMSASLFYDTRDDPFDPSKGGLHGIVVKLASRAFLSETDFIRGTFQSSWFFPLTKKIVFAFSLRGGAGYSYDNIKELPLVERFFLGGRTTVRGYNNDTLGPKGEDDTPTGGNVFALTNGEFRIALGKGFGLVMFVDAGNVWQLAEDIDPRLKYTAGAGLRYKTPVGPIRIDYGQKMNKDQGESSGELHFSFGHAF